MIEAKEIRCGNIFMHNSNWCYRQPESTFIDFEFAWTESDWYAIGECTMFLENVSPIPLTEEWLDKFLFVKDQNRECIWEKERLRISFGQNLSLAYLIDEDKNYGYFIPNHNIKYVHQVQNLWHALTGEELAPNSK